MAIMGLCSKSGTVFVFPQTLHRIRKELHFSFILGSVFKHLKRCSKETVFVDWRDFSFDYRNYFGTYSQLFLIFHYPRWARDLLLSTNVLHTSNTNIRLQLTYGCAHIPYGDHISSVAKLSLAGPLMPKDSNCLLILLSLTYFPNTQ